ncbi:MAG: hypothetical protein IJ327_00650 [Lachnospiraceae bacterium]|nr:hypothetical protein [Lachnospiraceae bacterium]
MSKMLGEMIKAGCNWCRKCEPGVDGILVTVGLCVIALLLCVVMKDSLTTFVETLVAAMTQEATNILTGVGN